jgi:hypothetical protein
MGQDFSKSIHSDQGKDLAKGRITSEQRKFVKYFGTLIKEPVCKNLERRADDKFGRLLRVFEAS